MIQKASGAAMFGHDSAKWPAYWFDAVAVVSGAMAAADAIEMAE